MIKVSKVFLIISLLLMIISEVLVAIQLIPDTRALKILVFLSELIPLLLCAIQYFYIIIKDKTQLKYLYELNMSILLLLVFSLISLYKIDQVGRFDFVTPLQIGQLVVPFFYTFFIINILSEKEISVIMRVALIGVFLGYILDKGIDTFTIENLKKISFWSSYSPFENSSLAELASALSTYFIYFRKKNPVECILSCILVFLIFKRGLLVMMLVLLIISLLGIKDVKISNWLKYGSMIFWVLITVFLFYLFRPENQFLFYDIFGTDVANFTMGRVYRIWYLFETAYKSFGYGSSTVSMLGSYFSGSSIELDLIKIYLELGLLALIVFIIVYFSIAKKNLYAYLIITFNMLNILLSSSLTNYLGWTLRILCIALIVSNEKNEKLFKVENHIPKIKIKI